MSKDSGHREDLVSDKLVTHHIFFMIDRDGIGPVDNFLAGEPLASLYIFGRFCTPGIFFRFLDSLIMSMEIF
jgi:hypothetical protein